MKILYSDISHFFSIQKYRVLSKVLLQIKHKYILIVLMLGLHLILLKDIWCDVVFVPAFNYSFVRLVSIISITEF